MTTSEFILARKLSLVRAAYLRFGPAWSTRVRRAGIQLSYRDFCTTSCWNASFDKLENLLRNYGMTCPLDDLGPARDYAERIRRVIEADIAACKAMQDPEERPTAGGMENPAMHPNDTLPLAEALAKEFNLPAIPIHTLPAENAAKGLRTPTAKVGIPDADKALNRLAALGFPADAKDLHKKLRETKEQKLREVRSRGKSRMPSGLKRLKRVTASRK